MKWNRYDLKQKAKSSFFRQYWQCVLVAFIMTLLLSGGSDTVSSSANVNVSPDGGVVHLDGGSLFPNIVTGVIVAAGIIGILLKIFVFNVFEVGGKKFFADNGRGMNAAPGELLDGFRSGYLNVVKILFFRDLYIGLWSLLLIIPGIVKAYEYRMVPYLLGENPMMDQKEAFEKSRLMMEGSKMDAFILELSFLGWQILNLFTFNLLYVFFLAPYMEATYAQLYLTLDQDASSPVFDVPYTEHEEGE